MKTVIILCVMTVACAIPIESVQTDVTDQVSTADPSDLRCSNSSGWKFCNAVNGDDICHAICQPDSYCGVCTWTPGCCGKKGKWTGPNGLASECPQTGEPPIGDIESIYVCQPGEPLLVPGPAVTAAAGTGDPTQFCSVLDQQAGKCAPFSLAGAKSGSRKWAQTQYPAYLGVDVTCTNGGGYWGCDLKIDLGAIVLTAGCTLWSDGALECGVD